MMVKKMKKKLVVCLMSALFMFGMVNIVPAAVLDFDTLSGSGRYVGNYEGFRWGNLYSRSYYSGYNSSYNNTLPAVSGDRFAYSWYRATAQLSDGSDFDFNGAYLTGWTRNDADFRRITANSVTIRGYNNGTLVDTYVASLSIGSMNYFDVAMNGVDQLRFTANHGYFLMDDFTYNETAPAPVPEPATMLLFGMGLVGLVGSRLKKSVRSV